MLSPQAVPPGFEPAFSGNSFSESGFTGLCGPLYVRHAEDAPPVLALRIAEKHLNLRGIAHGGLLVTLADTALGHALNRARGKAMALVTASLSTDFAEAAHLGDWVEAQVDIQRIGGRMAFANCYLCVGTRRILRASGVFAVVQPLPATARLNT